MWRNSPLTSPKKAADEAILSILAKDQSEGEGVAVKEIIALTIMQNILCLAASAHN